MHTASSACHAPSSANSSRAIFLVHCPQHLVHARAQESFNAETYTQEGMDLIQSTTFKNLLLRHYPELSASIGNPLGGNAFYAWTGTPLYGSADITSVELGSPGACLSVGSD